MSHANYRIYGDYPTHIIIEDLGPWDEHPTITNDAEHVVQGMAPNLKGRRLFYIDSEKNCDELLVTADGMFGGFKSGGLLK